MSRSRSVDGHRTDPVEEDPVATATATANANGHRPDAGAAMPATDGVAEVSPNGSSAASAGGSSGGRHAVAGRNGAPRRNASSTTATDSVAVPTDGRADERLVGPNGLGSPDLLARRTEMRYGNGVADRPAVGGPATRPFRTREQPAQRTGRRRHAAVAPAPGLLGRAIRWVLLLAVTATAVFGLRQYVIASYYIPSASMETTLHGCPGCQPDMVLVDKLSYRFRGISRRDVVVFARPPQAPPEDKQLIKRVIGLPGDVVSGHDGHVFIDNKELVEPYVNPACHGTADFAAIRVPAGRYFVMGDNRCDSFDSRMFGTIPRSAMIGRAFAVVWPMHHLRWL
jgi:signal peptidase I